MGFQLPFEIKEALEKINFINRYRAISEKYRSDEKFVYDNNEILSVLEELGYPSKYDKKENFFQFSQKISMYQFKFNFSFKYCLVEFIWEVWRDGDIQLGDPWAMLRRLMNVDEAIKPPKFSNYDELREILKEAFQMYEDFKKELLSIYDCNNGPF